MSDIPKALLAASLTMMGLLGLYYKVDYSSWVLFIGLMVAIS